MAPTPRKPQTAVTLYTPDGAVQTAAVGADAARPTLKRPLIHTSTSDRYRVLIQINRPHRRALYKHMIVERRAWRGECAD